MSWAERVFQTAFLKGRILHEGTSQPIDGTLSISIDEGPSIQHLLDDGTFALSGLPEELFPHLSIRAYDVHLNIHAVSNTFRDGYRDHSDTITIPAGRKLDPSQHHPVDSLPDAGTIYMKADPVTVRVRLLDASQNNAPLTGAAVTVVAGTFSGGPTVISENVYEFSDLPSVDVVTVSCEKTLYHPVDQRSLRVDYSRNVQEVAIGLKKQ
jgi:hypothetical protein